MRPGGAVGPVAYGARVPERSYFAGVNPVAKLMALVVIVLTLTFVFDPITPAVFLAVILIAGRLLGNVHLRSLARPLWVFVLAGVGIVIANILFNKENAVSPALFYLGPVKVTLPALRAAASLWLRLLCFALASLVFVRTTDPADLILSLVHQLRMNYRVAFGSMVGYGMLPVFQSEYQTIRAAQRLRGAREARGPVGSLVRLRRHALPLLTGAVRRAGRIAMAMDARAFGSMPCRTYRRRMRITARDAIFLGVVVLTSVALVLGLWSVGLTRFTLW